MRDPSMRRPWADYWWRPFKKIDDIEISHVDLTPEIEFEAEAFEWLNAEERVRWERFLFPGPKRRFALCRSALRRLLCERLRCTNDDLTFAEMEFGKPYAIVQGKPASISFNVSHSGGHGLIAVAAEGRIGVDVEERVSNRHLDLLVDTVLGPNERNEIGSLSGGQKLSMFFNLWTVKEALIKALGAGISLDTSKFEVPSAMRKGAKRSVFKFPHLSDVRWQLEDLSTDEFAAAIAYELEQ